MLFSETEVWESPKLATFTSTAYIQQEQIFVFSVRHIVEPGGGSQYSLCEYIYNACGMSIKHFRMLINTRVRVDIEAGYTDG